MKLNLRQWQQKNKFTDEDMANNCNMSIWAYADIRRRGSPKTSVMNILKIQKFTGLDFSNIIVGCEELKRIKAFRKQQS